MQPRKRSAEVHHVEIQDAKLHYHARTDEFYYIIDGQGTMQLDDETIEYFLEHVRADLGHTDSSGHLIEDYIGSDVLGAKFPKLVHCRISGFGGWMLRLPCSVPSIAM